ncbi:hypothetical protein O3P69_018561 [Scylla paramamosain]|uniref:Ionotropic glutamate receptor L-glutamate and glycine-binding domain-containing protein n=1 Tax=Scylla paramamosain TaxID=85552 RepID=A0AAW0T2S6_SCYPA
MEVGGNVRKRRRRQKGTSTSAVHTSLTSHIDSLLLSFLSLSSSSCERYNLTILSPRDSQHSRNTCNTLGIHKKSSTYEYGEGSGAIPPCRSLSEGGADEGENFESVQRSECFCLNHEYLEPPDGLWGAKFPNGSWFGMMGMLHRREVDVAIGPFGVTLERTKVADFSVPITATDHAVLYRRPQIEPDLLGFTKPFTLLESLLVFSSSRLHAHAVPAVLNLKGGEGARFLAGLWLLTSLIIAIVYRSNLKAMLIVPKVRVPFDSLAELVDQTEVPWTMAHGSIVQSFFSVSSPVYLCFVTCTTTTTTTTTIII